MYYPTKFPAEAQDRVEAVNIRAGQKFDRDKRESRNRDIERLLHRYILRVFRMFVREAKRLRVWRATDLDWEAREFLRQLTIELYSEKGFDNSGRRLASPVDHISGSLLSGVRRDFERSPEWRYFEAARLAMAIPLNSQAIEVQAVLSGTNIEQIDAEAVVQERRAKAVTPQSEQTARETLKESSRGKEQRPKPSQKKKKKAALSTLSFTTELNQVIFAVLCKHPTASAFDVCGHLDTHYMVELPSGMKTTTADKRSFASAYKHSRSQRHALDQRISNVRTSMRRAGMLRD